MDDKDKAKKILLEQLGQKDAFLLNSIYLKLQQHSISDEYVETAIRELEDEGRIRTEDLRKMFWELRIINTQI